jgi:hypothetical protein
VQAHNKGRGYEVGENQFLLVRDDELEAAEQEGRRRPYSSVSVETLQHSEQPGAANLEPPKRLFTSAPMKSPPRREEEPLAPAEPKTRPDPMPASVEVAPVV